MKKNPDLEKLLKLYRSTRPGKGSFETFAPLLTRKVFAEAYAGRKSPFSLKKLAEKVRYEDRYCMWQRIFEMHDLIPQDELLPVYISCINDPVKSCGEIFRFNSVHPEFPQSVELLIENKDMCDRYCRAKKPGWEMLRYLSGRQTSAIVIPEQMRYAISNDIVEMFLIYKDMAGKNIRSVC